MIFESEYIIGVSFNGDVVTSGDRGEKGAFGEEVGERPFHSLLSWTEVSALLLI